MMKENCKVTNTSVYYAIITLKIVKYIEIINLVLVKSFHMINISKLYRINT